LADRVAKSAVSDAQLSRLRFVLSGCAVELGRTDADFARRVERRRARQERSDGRDDAHSARLWSDRGRGREERGAAMYVLTGLGQAQDRGDCSGWEKDPQSFAKRVAEHYARTALGRTLHAQRIRRFGGDHRTLWEVWFPDNIVVGVSFSKLPEFVGASRIFTDPMGPIRHYDYSCTAKGDLVLTERKLP
jgi:hypothetical protein